MNVFYFDWEMDLLYALQRMHCPILDGIMAFLSNIGNAGILWIAFTLVLIILPKYRRVGLQMLIAMALTYIVGNLFIKNMVMRARPCQIDTTVALLVNMPSDYSFPSGHAMNGFATSVALCINNKKLGIPAVVLAMLIAFSRLYNFVHFPTDVLFGAAFGALVAFVVCMLYKKRLKNKGDHIYA